MSNDFNLPGASFDELQKIIKGYSHAPDQVSLDSLSRLTGLHTSQISRNSKFLTNLGLISGGVKKSATDLGRKLGRALDHKQIDDAKGYWREAVQSNEKMASLVTTVRIKDGITEKDFSGHVLYASGQSNSKVNQTGARCIVDILVYAELVIEENGKLVVSAPQIINDNKSPESSSVVYSDAQNSLGIDKALSTPPDLSNFTQSAVNLTPQIAINIQLHLPETDNAEVYEKLFRALRENLLLPKE